MSKFTGTVVEGQKKGATLGYPTANIAYDDHNVSGIYAARVTLHSGEEYEAAVYADAARKFLEAHILDFTGDLYGQEITIDLQKKIREDKKFANEDDLLTAISEDVAQVREYFES